jgi:hypothetical protein
MLCFNNNQVSNEIKLIDDVLRDWVWGLKFSISKNNLITTNLRRYYHDRKKIRLNEDHQ